MINAAQNQQQQQRLHHNSGREEHKRTLFTMNIVIQASAKCDIIWKIPSTK